VTCAVHTCCTGVKIYFAVRNVETSQCLETSIINLILFLYFRYFEAYHLTFNCRLPVNYQLLSIVDKHFRLLSTWVCLKVDGWYNRVGIRAIIFIQFY